MSQIQLWNPFKELDGFQSRLSRMLADDWMKTGTSYEPTFAPTVDISEDKEAFHFKVDLPDMKKEDIKVECHDGVLTISGEKKAEKEIKGDGRKFHRIERSYGSFMRSFTLPETANTDVVNAEYLNGVLDLKIAKRQVAAPKAKTITIN